MSKLLTEIGQVVLDRIVDKPLCRCECAHNADHGCVIVWDEDTAERIGWAIFDAILKLGVTLSPLGPKKKVLEVDVPLKTEGV